MTDGGRQSGSTEQDRGDLAGAEVLGLVVSGVQSVYWTSVAAHTRARINTESGCEGHASRLADT